MPPWSTRLRLLLYGDAVYLPIEEAVQGMNISEQFLDNSFLVEWGVMLYLQCHLVFHCMNEKFWVYRKQPWTSAVFRKGLGLLNHYFTASGETGISGIALRTIWEVEADSDYAARGFDASETSRHVHPFGGVGLIAIRSLGGKGEIRLHSGKILEMGSEHLLITEWEHLRYYKTAGSHWNFWWFEFTMMGPPELPMHQLIEVPHLEGDDEIFQEACLALRQPGRGKLRLASVSFSLLLHRWLAHYEGGSQNTPQGRAIEGVIAQMHDKITEPWTVKDMARAAHMGERYFRKTFHDYTGQSPKQFYDELRMVTAMEYLRYGVGSVSEVAYRVGFSCPFHFSRTFKKRFGIAPSSIRR